MLSKWLDLPTTPWPPDHYALLGLQPGQGETDEIELRVLERMEKLRRYQLIEPERATEGMNLLAQAMICLTDPAARIEYDRERGLRSIVELPTEADDEDEIPAVPVIEIPLPRRKTRIAKPAAVSMPEVYSLEKNRTPTPDAILIPELADEEPLPLLEVEEEEQFERDREPPPPPIQSLPERDRRRKIYAELVRIRRVLHVWERLRAYLDDPEKAFARRTETIAFMTCLAELRPLLPTVADLIGGSNEPGNLIGVLSRQQLVVEMFRSLLSSQREALAQDCRKAHYVLAERYRFLRAEIRVATAKSFGRRVWLPMGRAAIARPEWFFLIVGATALAIAFYRSLPK